MMKRLIILFTFCLFFLFKVENGIAAFDSGDGSSPLPTQPPTQEIQVPNQNSWYDVNFNTMGKAYDAADKDKEINADVKYYFDINALAMGASTSLVGFKGNEKTKAELERNFAKSVLGQTTYMTAFLYNNPPGSTSEYLADVFNRAGLIPKTYAQGVTYSRFLPILPIWKIFRDIAYILLTLVMLLIGLMIMFRQKINANAVASIESTIPNVVITLILITFSFPIATLILDLMYILIAGGVALIGSAVGDPNVATAIKDLTTGGFTALFGHVMAPAGNYAGSLIGPAAGGAIGLGAALLFTGPVGWVVGILITLVGGGIYGATLANGQADAGSVLFGVVSPIFFLLVVLALFFSVFKIFFILLMCYVQIVTYIIFAPLLLLLNAVPGQKAFENWWKNIAANAAAFVAAAILLYVGWAISFMVSKLNSPFWTAPFIVQGLGVPQATSAILSIGISLMIPDLIKKVKEMFKVKPVASFGLSNLTGPASAGIGQGFGLVGQYNAFAQGIGRLPFVPKGLKDFFDKGQKATSGGNTPMS